MLSQRRQNWGAIELLFAFFEKVEIKTYVSGSFRISGQKVTNLKNF